jgi:hypothetical protein
MTRLVLSAACLLVLVTSFAPARQDAVKAKLDAAKVAYKVAFVDYRQAVGAWFDKREAAARKDGNKKAVDSLKAERKAFEDKGGLPAGAPKGFQEKLTAARANLEATYQEVIKGYVRASQDALAEAVEKDLKEFLKEVGADPNASVVKAPPPVIPAAKLKAKLAGRATYDQKTGVLTITYRFADKNEFKDFDFGDAKPKPSSPAALVLQPKESAKHVIRFDTIEVSGVISLREMRGNVLTTSDGAVVALGGQNPDGIYLNTRGSSGTVSAIVPASVRGGSIRFRVTVGEKTAEFQYANERLTQGLAQPSAGQVTLHGGDNFPFSYSSLTISGKVNAEWAATFFAE